MDDLRPYCCVESNCVLKRKTFSRRRELVKHELSHHKSQLGFYQCVLERCQAKFKDPVSVMRHQSADHNINRSTFNGSLSDSMTVSVVDRIASIRDVLAEYGCCPRCDAVSLVMLALFLSTGFVANLGAAPNKKPFRFRLLQKRPDMRTGLGAKKSESSF